MENVSILDAMIYLMAEVYEDIEIEWETKHPDYDSSSLDNDLMMVKLAESSSYIPVALDDGSQTLTSGTDVTVMGWVSSNTSCHLMLNFVHFSFGHHAKHFSLQP